VEETSAVQAVRDNDLPFLPQSSLGMLRIRKYLTKLIVNRFGICTVLLSI